MDLKLTNVQCETAAKFLSDLKLSDITSACGVDISEPFDSEGALQRLIDAGKRKCLWEVLSIFDEFSKDDNLYTVAEAITSSCLHEDVVAQYWSEVRHKESLLVKLLGTHLYPERVREPAYVYLLEKVCDLASLKRDISLLRIVYAFANDRFPSMHEVCQKLVNTGVSIGEILFRENAQNARALFSLWNQLQYTASSNSFYNKIAGILIPLAEEKEDAKVLEGVISNSHRESSLSRDAAFALARVVLHKEGIDAVVWKCRSFIEREVSKDTYELIGTFLSPFIDANIDTAVTEGDADSLLKSWGYFGSDHDQRSTRIFNALYEIAVRGKDVDILMALYEETGEKDQSCVILESLIAFTVEKGDAETLKRLTKNAKDTEVRNIVIRARIELLYKQGLLT